jgi:hypothetical protein
MSGCPRRKFFFVDDVNVSESEVPMIFGKSMLTDVARHFSRMLCIRSFARPPENYSHGYTSVQSLGPRFNISLFVYHSQLPIIFSPSSPHFSSHLAITPSRLTLLLSNTMSVTSLHLSPCLAYYSFFLASLLYLTSHTPQLASPSSPPSSPPPFSDLIHTYHLDRGSL